MDWGKLLPIPKPDAWAKWVRKTMGRLEKVERIVSDAVVIKPKRSGSWRANGTPSHPVDPSYHHLHGLSDAGHWASQPQWRPSTFPMPQVGIALHESLFVIIGQPTWLTTATTMASATMTAAPTTTRKTP